MDEPTERQKHRERKREYAKEGVRTWHTGLTTHKTMVREHARREWNFEKFYTRIQKLAPGITREELKEYITANGITLANKPKPGGKAWSGGASKGRIEL